MALKPVMTAFLCYALASAQGVAQAPAEPVSFSIQRLAVNCCSSEAAVYEYLQQVSYLPWQLEGQAALQYGDDNYLLRYVLTRLQQGDLWNSQGYAEAIAELTPEQQAAQLTLLETALSYIDATAVTQPLLSPLGYLLAQLREGKPSLAFHQRFRLYSQANPQQRAILANSLFNDEEQVILPSLVLLKE